MDDATERAVSDLSHEAQALAVVDELRQAGLLAIEWGAELDCFGCGDEITPRYAMYGVCKNCFGTTDDPFLAERGLDL